MADSKQTQLKARITRLRNLSKTPGLTLAEKLDLKSKVKVAEKALLDYRLNIFKDDCVPE